MEEAVTRKFIHLDSSVVTSLCSKQFLCLKLLLIKLLKVVNTMIFFFFSLLGGSL